MSKMRKIKIMHESLFLIAILFSLLFLNQKNVIATDINVELQIPKNVRIIRSSDTSLKLKWKSAKNADGYVIYKYNQAKKKYQSVSKLKGNTSTEWTDKKLVTNKVYQYKVASYKKVKGEEYYSKLSKYVKAKPYKRTGEKINAGAPKVSSKKVYLGFSSQKKIKAVVFASKYGKNKNKKAFDTKVRWYSTNKTIAKVDNKGVITAGAKEGTCAVYAMAHNGKKTKISVTVKNYARPKYYYNCFDERDLYVLITSYADLIQDVAEYYSINRINSDETIKMELNDDAEMVIMPNVDIPDELKKTIETLLVDFPYYLKIRVYEDGVEFCSKQEDTENSISGYVYFWFDDNCNQLDTQIASHWEAIRFYPD